MNTSVPATLTVLVSRHPGAIDWMRRTLGLPDAPVISHLDALDALDRVPGVTGVTGVAGAAGVKLGPGLRLAGVLPLRWAALACEAGAEVWSLDLDIQEHQRGRELSAADLDAAGARLVRYQVTALPPSPKTFAD